MALGPPLREETKRKRIGGVEEEATEGLIIECEQLMAGGVLAAAKSKWRQRRQQSAELNNGDSHVGTHPTAAFAAVGAPTALGSTGVVVVPAVRRQTTECATTVVVVVVVVVVVLHPWVVVLLEVT